jgi:hypothetical protein
MHACSRHQLPPALLCPALPRSPQASQSQTAKAIAAVAGYGLPQREYLALAIGSGLNTGYANALTQALTQAYNQVDDVPPTVQISECNPASDSIQTLALQVIPALLDMLCRAAHALLPQTPAQ